MAPVTVQASISQSVELAAARLGSRTAAASVRAHERSATHRDSQFSCVTPELRTGARNAVIN